MLSRLECLNLLTKWDTKGRLRPFAEITTIIFYLVSVSVVSFSSTDFSFSLIFSFGVGFPSRAAEIAVAFSLITFSISSATLGFCSR
jgi:hypothetical protein